MLIIQLSNERNLVFQLFLKSVREAQKHVRLACCLTCLPPQSCAKSYVAFHEVKFSRIIIMNTLFLATSADDVVIKPVPKAEPTNVRSKWDHGGKTQLVSALGKANIQKGTFGIPAGDCGSTTNLDNQNDDVNNEKQEKKKPVFVFS